MKYIFTIFACLVLLVSVVAQGQTPHKVLNQVPQKQAVKPVAPKSTTDYWAPTGFSYQGVLVTDAGAPVTDGLYSLQFDLYTHSTDGDLRGHEVQDNVMVKHGTFSAIIGTGIDAYSLPDGDSLFVELTALAGPGITTQHTFARSLVTCAPYAMRAQQTIGPMCRTGGGYSNALGYNNNANGCEAAIGGGVNNYAADECVVGGGVGNSANGSDATIGGGTHNYASGGCVVGGGAGDSASGSYATIGGGSSNTITSDGSTISGGLSNKVTPYDVGGIISNGTIGGGTGNWVRKGGSTIGGGVNNVAGSDHANYAWGIDATIGGGESNWAEGTYSTVAGGYNNHSGMTMTMYVSAGTTIGGGAYNGTSYEYTTIGGGYYNAAGNPYSTVAGGQNNRAIGYSSSIGGGQRNEATADYASVCGGAYNKARGGSSFVGGGGDSNPADSNSAIGDYSVVAGGEGNKARGSRSTVCGGSWNDAGGGGAIIAGGFGNVANGDFSFAAGYQAQANNYGAFVWSDASGGPMLGSSLNNQFSVRASGGVRIYSNTGLFAGVTLAPGANAWVGVSDSTKKRNIRLVDGKDILAKVAQLPMNQWSFKSQDPSIEHIGPMAQDFYRIFHLGESDTTISTIDPSGIALAAIQELVKENQQLQQQVSTLTETNTELTERLVQVEKAVQQLTAERKETGNKSLGELK